MFALMGDDVGSDGDPGADAAVDAGTDGGDRPRSTRRGGAMLSAAMLGLDIALGRKPREEIPVVVDANGDPVDIDGDGIVVPIDETANAVAPPLPRRAPMAAPRRRRRG